LVFGADDVELLADAGRFQLVLSDPIIGAAPKLGENAPVVGVLAAPGHAQPKIEKLSPEGLFLVHALSLNASKRFPSTKLSLLPSCKIDIGGSDGVSIQ
jgi:hypothetical protein